VEAGEVRPIHKKLTFIQLLHLIVALVSVIGFWWCLLTPTVCGHHVDFATFFHPGFLKAIFQLGCFSLLFVFSKTKALMLAISSYLQITILNNDNHTMKQKITLNSYQESNQYY